MRTSPLVIIPSDLNASAYHLAAVIDCGWLVIPESSEEECARCTARHAYCACVPMSCMLTLTVRAGMGQESPQTCRNRNPCQAGAESLEALATYDSVYPVLALISSTHTHPLLLDPATVLQRYGASHLVTTTFRRRQNRFWAPVPVAAASEEVKQLGRQK